MNWRDSDYLQKQFSELCVISEDQKTFQGVIRWNIPNGEIKRKLQSVGKCVRSNKFSIGSPSYCSFYLLFYPNGKTTENFFSTSIVFNTKLPDSAWVGGEIRFDEIDVHKTFSASAKEFNRELESAYESDNSGLRAFVCKFSLDVVMHCSIKISLREITCAFDKEKTCYTESRNYDSNKPCNSFSDVSIIINEYQFMTHKSLLAQIPYFQQLFDANESEQVFVITDIESEIFKHIVAFLYSGEIPRLYFKLACELYIAASDLNMFNLKNLCSSYLGANLTETNVIMVLKFSHEYEDIALKKECFKFIKKSDVETLTAQSIVL